MIDVAIMGHGVVGSGVAEILLEHWDAIAQKAVDRQIGARGLRAVMEQTMMKVMYVIPSDLSIKKVIINADCINGGVPQLVRDKANPREKIGIKK